MFYIYRQRHKILNMSLFIDQYYYKTLQKDGLRVPESAPQVLKHEWPCGGSADPNYKLIKLGIQVVLCTIQCPKTWISKFEIHREIQRKRGRVGGSINKQRMRDVIKGRNYVARAKRQEITMSY